MAENDNLRNVLSDSGTDSPGPGSAAAAGLCEIIVHNTSSLNRDAGDDQQLLSSVEGHYASPDTTITSDNSYWLESVDHGHHLSHSFVVPPRRRLKIFAGVFSPVALSMFSTALFLRLGFVVGQSGIILALVQFMLAYLILYLTILSICAISTNGAVEGGGAYYMISRALGPEFGGSIGLLFFLANVFSCALYISGFVEGLVDNFGPGGSSLPGGASGLPADPARWWAYLYATLVLALCLVVCLIGGAMFARTSVFILVIVGICTISVVISAFVKGEDCIEYPDSNDNVAKVNETLIGDNNTEAIQPPCANYTGISSKTFSDNLWANYTVDYVTGNKMDFLTVFAILFSSVTGIMNGANMSGELKNPSRAIPRGTLSAACFTLSTYLVLCFLSGATCTRDLLIGNYNYLQDINIWRPFVVIGIFATTLSAALGNLIGASRVLEALARDDIFWKFLRPATISTNGGNPIVAVLITWVLVQAVLLIGSLNAIAPLASELFMLSYASTNLACLALQLASAPNFRPTFQYFSWHTSLCGLIGCVIMAFLINAIYASVAIVVCLVLTIVLHLRDLPASWGSISQALIFHQVRKYLLLLDTRKDHVKFWRPQMLLFVHNPRVCCELIEFINDLKKGGLYVLGHVRTGNLDSEMDDPCQLDMPKWSCLVDRLKIKAFVELTLAKSVREGMQHLVRVSGLGGMKPNTICFGFYDDTRGEDSFARRRSSRRRHIIRFYTSPETDEWQDLQEAFPLGASSQSGKSLLPEEYVHMVYDSLKLNKNVCLCRHFPRLNREEIVRSKKPDKYVDVWPINFFRPDTASYFDSTCLFMLQLACILHMVPGWKSSTMLRVQLCVDQNEDSSRKEAKLSQLLQDLRIPGEIHLVQWDQVLGVARDTGMYTDGLPTNWEPSTITESYLQEANSLIRSQCNSTAVVFCYLPRVPEASRQHLHYLHSMDVLTRHLPPTVLVHGIHPVTSTTL